MALEIVHESIEMDSTLTNNNSPSKGILVVDSDDEGGLDEEPFLEEELEPLSKAPRVEFIPRERPMSSGRPRDNRERGRGGAEKAQEEDLSIRQVRGRLNLAMVDATFSDVETKKSSAGSKKNSQNNVQNAQNIQNTHNTHNTQNTLNSSNSPNGTSSRPTSAGSTTSLTTAALIPDEKGTLGSNSASNEDLSKYEANRLQSEFAMYLNQGKQFAKESLISRLEAELEDVERELAHIDQFRSPDNKRRRPATAGPKGRGSGMSAVRSARPSSSSRSRPSTANTSRSRPSTANRSRPSTANRSRPSTANRSRPNTATRSRPNTGGRSRGGEGGGKVNVDADDEIMDDYASDDSDFAVPETSGGRQQNGRPSTATIQRGGASSKRGNSNSRNQRPSTAGPLRGNNNGNNSQQRGHKNGGAGSRYNSNKNNNNNNNRSKSAGRRTNGTTAQSRNRRNRPQSSPLVRATSGGNKFDADPGFVKGEIAGYKPPNLKFDDDTLARARTLTREDIQAVFKLDSRGRQQKHMAMTPAGEACLRVGIQPRDLLPRPVSTFTTLKVGFKTLPVGKEEAYQRWSAYDEQRQRNLAATLFERERIKEERSSGFNEPNKGQRPSTAPARGRSPTKVPERTLKDRVQKAMTEEKDRVDQVTRNRERNRKARQKENDQLQKERNEWAELQARKTQRTRDVLRKRTSDEKKRAKKAKERSEAIQKIRMEKQRLDDERLQMGNDRQEKSDRRLALLQKEKKREARRKHGLSSKREKHRSEVAAERTAALNRRAEQARHKMAVKEGHVRRMRESRYEEQERKKKDAVFKQQTLKERRDRIRRQQEYGRNSLAAKLQIRAARQKKIKALDYAVLSERRAMYKTQLVAQHKMEATSNRLSTETPGPGSYKIPSTLNLNAGRKIGKSSAASYIDVIVNRASKIPAPGQYGQADYKPSVTVVKFSTSSAPSELEWAIMRAGDTPAPDVYQAKISKGMMSTSVRKKMEKHLLFLNSCCIWRSTLTFFTFFYFLFFSTPQKKRVPLKLEIVKVKVKLI